MMNSGRIFYIELFGVELTGGRVEDIILGGLSIDDFLSVLNTWPFMCLFFGGSCFALNVMRSSWGWKGFIFCFNCSHGWIGARS